MANMPHCKFRNTLADLRDCFLELEILEGETDDIENADERAAAKNLIKLCKLIATVVD